MTFIGKSFMTISSYVYHPKQVLKKPLFSTIVPYHVFSTYLVFYWGIILEL